MSSYLEIYLQKKKKEGEEKGERLLLCSISRADEIYSLFYDNNVGCTTDDGLHEFDSSDFTALIDELTERMSNVLMDIMHDKENLHLISNKDSIAEILDSIKCSKEYYQRLMSDRTILMSLGTLFSDVGKEWCDFNKLYWKIA